MSKSFSEMGLELVRSNLGHRDYFGSSDSAIGLGDSRFCCHSSRRWLGSFLSNSQLGMFCLTTLVAGGLANPPANSADKSTVNIDTK